MPSWPAENEVKLLLTIIKIENPKIPRATWKEIAATMGVGYTQEAVRQKYQNMKRESEASDAKAAGLNGPNAVKSTVAKSKTTAKSTASEGKTNTANKKRKAVTPATDDEEDFKTPAKTRKLAVEKAEAEDESFVKVKAEAESSGHEIVGEAKALKCLPDDHQPFA